MLPITVPGGDVTSNDCRLKNSGRSSSQIRKKRNRFLAASGKQSKKKETDLEAARETASGTGQRPAEVDDLVAQVVDDRHLEGTRRSAALQRNGQAPKTKNQKLESTQRGPGPSFLCFLSAEAVRS